MANNFNTFCKNNLIAKYYNQKIKFCRLRLKDYEAYRAYGAYETYGAYGAYGAYKSYWPHNQRGCNPCELHPLNKYEV